MTTLLQLDKLRTWNVAESLGFEYRGSFMCVEPGVYVIDFDGDYSDITGDSSFDGYQVDLGLEVKEIGSIVVDTETRLTRVYSYEDLATEPSFYNDIANRRCFFRLPDYAIADNHLIAIGLPEYIADRAVFDGDTPYNPYLKSSINVIDSRDNLVNGVFQYNGFSADLHNEIDLTGLNLINSSARIYEFDGTTKSIVYSGYVESLSQNASGLNVSIQDTRKSFDAPILESTLSISSNPNMKEGQDGDFIPIRLGNCIEVKALCLNGDQYEKADAGTYTFIVTDPKYGAVQSITNAKIKGAPIAIASTDLTACTFTITKPADETIAVDDVVVDVNSYTGVSNGADIIQWLFENIQGIQYTANRFNTTEWAAAKAVMYDSFLNIEKQTSVNEAIEMIATSNLVLFAVEIDGKITLRIEDLDATPVISVDFEALENYLDVNINEDNEDVYAEVIVTYNGGKKVPKTDDRAKKLYSSKKSLELEYNLATDAAAEAVAARVLELVNTRRDRIELSFQKELVHNYSAIKANDIITVSVPWRGDLKVLCMQTDKDTTKESLRVSGAIIEG